MMIIIHIKNLMKIIIIDLNIKYIRFKLKYMLYMLYIYTMFNGQAEQDKFVLNVLKNKKNGFFLEVGSHDPIKINNSYILEKNYEWNGIMIEFQEQWLDKYKISRPNSIHVINDATTIDYKELFETNNVPLNLDYLQIDLAVNNGSTLNTLKKINSDVMDKHKFATITFEHDIYHTNYLNTRSVSREIFEDRGYIRVFSDITNGPNPFEDWYIHPDLVDIDLVNNLIKKNEKNYKPTSKKHIRFDESHEIKSIFPVNKSINWKDIEY
jgi:hypothetical protein